MKSYIRDRYNDPKYSKIKHLGKLVTITGSAQVLVQAVALISGILIVRLLPTKEYALYTLVNTMLGTMTVLADGGIATGVIAQGGKVWQDRDQLGTVLVSGMDLRKKFAIFSLAFAIPMLTYLLWKHEATWIEIALIVGSLIPSFIAALSDSLLEVPLKLHQDISSLQKNQIIVNIARLGLLFITIFIFPYVYIAMLATGLPRIWGNIKLRKMSESYANWNQSISKESQKETLKVVKRILPGAIYFSLSGQITTWLISIFGNTSSVAQIGALGRITMLLSLFSTVFATIIMPRFSRMPTDSKILMKRYFQIIVALLVICICVIGCVWLFSSQILWILGPNYKGLDKELLLSIIGSVFGLISGSSFVLTSGRGWILNPIITISINLAAIALGIVLFNISTLYGILIFNIFISAIQAVRAIVYGFVAISSNNKRNRDNLLQVG